MRGAWKDKTYNDCFYNVDSHSLTVDRELDVLMPRIGRFEGTGNFVRSYVLPHITAHFCIQGPSYIVLDKREYKMEPGDLLFILDGQLITVREVPGISSEHLWFDFSGSAINEVLGSIGVSTNNQFFTAVDSTEVSAIFNQFSESAERNSLTQCHASMCGWRLLHLVEQQQKDDLLMGVQNRLPTAIKVMVNQQYRSAITISALARHFSMSRSTLFRIFKGEFGISPKQYLDELRFNYAVYLVKSTSLGLKEVAHSAGYENIQSFYYMFQKKYHCSPAKWRKENV